MWTTQTKRERRPTMKENKKTKDWQTQKNGKWMNEKVIKNFFKKTRVSVKSRLFLICFLFLISQNWTSKLSQLSEWKIFYYSMGWWTNKNLLNKLHAFLILFNFIDFPFPVHFSPSGAVTTTTTATSLMREIYLKFNAESVVCCVASAENEGERACLKFVRWSTKNAQWKNLLEFQCLTNIDRKRVSLVKLNYHNRQQ